MECFNSGRVLWVRVRHASVLTDEVWHCQDTAHPAGIITKEDTTKGSKGTDQVGSHGDGGLEARRVRRPRNDNGCYSSSRHDGGDVDCNGPWSGRFQRDEVVRGRKERDMQGGCRDINISVCWTTPAPVIDKCRTPPEPRILLGVREHMIGRVSKASRKLRAGKVTLSR